MSYATQPIVAASYSTLLFQLVAGHSTQPQIVYTDPNGNGCKIIDLAVYNTDSSHNITLFKARKLTSKANTGSVTLTKNASVADTIVRASGSFVTDGFLQNQRILIQGATTLLNNVGAFLNAAVTSTTLSIPFGTLAGTETEGSGVDVWLLDQIVAPFAATSVTVVNCITQTLFPQSLQQPNSWLILGPNEALCVATATNMTALTYMVLYGEVANW